MLPAQKSCNAAATRPAAGRLDIDVLIRHGIDLPHVLAAGAVVYGRSFNPLITLKALSYSTMCRRCRPRCANGCERRSKPSTRPVCRC
jgi:hypothetical protein